jgi:hypothetical protein
MKERLTDQARRILWLAGEEAERSGDRVVATEHLLLALIRDGSSPAARVLQDLGLDLRMARLQIEMKSGPTPRGKGEGTPAPAESGAPAAPQAKQDAALFAGFSGQARQAVQLAYREAHRLGHDYLGTEHLLLGVLREGAGGVVRLLAACGTDAEKAYREVNASLTPGSGDVAWDRLPLTPGTRRALHHAREEAAALHHPCVGPEHLLAGALREPDTTAAQLLLGLGVTLERMRPELARLPAPDNRDWLLRPEPAPGTSAPADPSPGALAAVVTEEVLPGAPPPAPTRPAPRPAQTSPGPRPTADEDLRVLESQLQALQFLVALGVGGLIGFLRAGFFGGIVGALCGALVGGLLLAARSNSLSRVVGLGAGAVVGLHSGPANAVWQNGVLAIIGGLAGLVLGFCLGDWRKLMGPPRGEKPASPSKPVQPVETVTAQIGPPRGRTPF